MKHLRLIIESTIEDQPMFRKVVKDYAPRKDENGKWRATPDNVEIVNAAASSYDHVMFNHIIKHSEAGKHSEIHAPTTSMFKLQNNDLSGDLEGVPHEPSIHKHIISKLAEGDPSKDLKHLPHIARWYMNGHFRAEDLGSKEAHAQTPNWHTVHGVLKAFSDPKNKDKFPDFPNPENPKMMMSGTKLASYKDSAPTMDNRRSYHPMSFSNFRDMVHERLGLNHANMAEIANHPDLKLLGEKNGTKLYHIQSEDAAKHVAKCAGAKWCTGWEGGNMFHSYSKNLYLLHGKDGAVHQIHTESDQFMDKKDRPVQPEELVHRYPELHDIAKKAPDLHHYDRRRYDGNQDYKFPFMSQKEKTSLGNEHVNRLLSKTPYMGNSGFAAHLSDETHLKAFRDHLHKVKGSTTTKLITDHRLETEFGHAVPEDINPHEPRTPEHAKHILNRYQHYLNMETHAYNNLQNDDSIKEWTHSKLANFEHEARKHYHKSARESIFQYEGNFDQVSHEWSRQIKSFGG